MIIKTKADWIETARYVVPLLPDYAERISGMFDPSKIETELNGLVEAENWDMLRKRFHEFYHMLPDRSDIRVHPFGRLCDLCSEDWVFEE